MDNTLYSAAARGDCSILERGFENKYFLERILANENNFIHVAVGHEQADFIAKALPKFPKLIFERNSCGDTPFHVAAEIGNTSILVMLLTCCDVLAKQKRISSNDTNPWRARNLEGNTPLHVALIHGKLQFATMLVERDPELAGFVNNFGETPLHLAIKYRANDDRNSVLCAMKQVTHRFGANFKVHCPPAEDSEYIIRLLLEKKHSAACLRDSDGLTPLLVAASSNKPYLSAIECVLKYCPQSIEVNDPFKKNMLHLLSELSNLEDCQCLLDVPELHRLKNQRDSKGNTPAHIAVKNQNILMVQLLFRLSANFAIKNKQGFSAADLLQQQSVDFYNLIIAEKNGLLFSYKTIEGEMERLEKVIGNLHERGICSEPWHEVRDFFSSGGNILHNLFRMMSDVRFVDLWENNDIQQFIKQALDIYPSRVCETDSAGDTLLHCMAHIHPKFIDREVLMMFYHYFRKHREESAAGELYLPPWQMKNKEGNTPLHEALLSTEADVKCVVEFLKVDVQLASCQNNKMETPLHLLSQDAITLSLESFKEFKGIDWIPSIGRDRDKDDLTPVLKAAQENNLHLVKLLYVLWPSSACLPRKDDGQIFWHLLASQSSAESGYQNSILEQFLKSFDGSELRSHGGIFAHTGELIYKAANDGNTPLHLAIEKGNFRFAQFLLEYSELVQAELEDRENLPNILTIRNKQGVAPAAMIGTAEHIPRKFDNFLWRNPKLVKELLGVRSLSGLSTSLMKDYSNTLGVVAALLTTITFTAAFTVPGGLNDDKGTPFFLKNAAFQVFMVSDILAMCLSIVVLFCLLWIMTMSNKKESVVLLDLAVYLLRFSFYATLLAFMTGLYVTTFSVASWIAIFSCVLCSSLILLMHKGLIALCIPGFIKIFSLSQGATSKATSLLSDYLHVLFCWVPKRAVSCCCQQLNQNNGSRNHSSIHDRGDAQTERARPPPPQGTHYMV